MSAASRRLGWSATAGSTRRVGRQLVGRVREHPGGGRHLEQVREPGALPHRRGDRGEPPGVLEQGDGRAEPGEARRHRPRDREPAQRLRGTQRGHGEQHRGSDGRDRPRRQARGYAGPMTRQTAAAHRRRTGSWAYAGGATAYLLVRRYGCRASTTSSVTPMHTRRRGRR